MAVAVFDFKKSEMQKKAKTTIACSSFRSITGINIVKNKGDDLLNVYQENSIKHIIKTMSYKGVCSELCSKKKAVRPTRLLISQQVGVCGYAGT